MGLPRVLEPEVMDSAEEALDYDSMDHSQVNRAFVDDLLALGPITGDVLDLGTGTARIPIELCLRVEDVRVMAVDAAVAMLELARYNIEIAGCADRIQLSHVDAKQLPFAAESFAVVMSNSIVHHVAEPQQVLREALRVVQPGGLLFFRDLLRPEDDSAVARLVELYAADCNPLPRAMFEASLRAALTLAEIRDLVKELGFSADSVRPSSDRHWTWSVRK